MPRSPRRPLLGLLAAVVLALALAACAPDVAAEDFVGTFADGEGDTITLRADGTGTMTAAGTDYPEREGTWDLVVTDYGNDFIDFRYDDPPGLTGMGNSQFWFDSADRLYLLPNGPDGPDRHYFERT